VDPEGIEETNQQLKNQREEFTEMADTAEDSTGKLEMFSNRWKGAMRTFSVGLAIATGSLASKIPVVGELIESMSGVLQALVFRIDKALRPAFEGVQQELFKVQERVLEADNVFEALKEAIFGVAEVMDMLEGSLLAEFVENLSGLRIPQGVAEFFANLVTMDILGVMMQLRDAFANPESVITGIKQFGENISVWMDEHVIPGAIEAGKNVIGAIGDGLSGVLNTTLAWGEDIVSNIADGVMSEINSVVEAAGSIAEWVEIKIGGVVDDAIEWGKSIPSDIATGIQNAIESVQTWAGNVADGIAEHIPSLSDAKEWGKDLIDGIIQGLQEKSTELGAAVEQHISQVIRDRLPGSDAETGPLSDLSETGPALVDTVSQGMERSTSRAGDAASTVADAADPRAGGGFAARRRTRPTIVMDGRKLTEQDGRYRRDQTARRGRDG